MLFVRFFVVFVIFAVSAFAERRVISIPEPSSRGRAQVIVAADAVLVEVTHLDHKRGLHVLNEGRGKHAKLVEAEMPLAFNSLFAYGLSLLDNDQEEHQRHASPRKYARVEPLYIVSGRQAGQASDKPDDDAWRLMYYLNGGVYGGDVFTTNVIGWDWKQIQTQFENVDTSHGVIYSLDSGCPVHRDLDPKKFVFCEKVVKESGVYENDPSDHNGHSTSTTGVMAATPNNGVDIVGIAWMLNYGSLQVLSSKNQGTVLDIINGLIRASQEHDRRIADDPMTWSVVNMSLGGYGYSVALDNVINDVTAKNGMFIFAAAGNESMPTARTRTSRGAQELIASNPNVFVVSGTDFKGNLLVDPDYGSNFGASRGLAPGQFVMALRMGAGSMQTPGTSYAVTMYSGAASLTLTKHPEIRTRKQLWARLYGDKITSGLQVGFNYMEPTDLFNGGSKLNIAKALVDDVVAPTTPTVTTTVGHASIYQEIESSDESGLYGCELLLSKKPFETGDEDFVTTIGEYEPNALSGTAHISAEVEESSTYYTAARCYDLAGNVSPLTEVTEIHTPPSKQVVAYEAGSNQLTAIDGPTAAKLMAQLGLPPSNFWEVTKSQAYGPTWSVGTAIGGVSTFYGDYSLRIPLNLGGLVPGQTASLNIMVDNRITSNYNYGFQGKNPSDFSLGLVQLWVFSSEHPEGEKVADIRNTAEMEMLKFRVSQYAGDDTAYATIRVFLAGNNSGDIRVGRLAVTADEQQ